MKNWIRFGNNWFNLNDFCHVWVKKGVNGYFLMGELTQSKEQVALSAEFDSEKRCLDFVSRVFS